MHSEGRVNNCTTEKVEWVLEITLRERKGEEGYHT
jgi:hypothetical protein